MTLPAPGAVPAPDASTNSRLALTFARRELRGGLKGFRVFLACLALGVAAIAGVGSVSSALVEGLSKEGQTILGGDVDLRLMHREASAEERAYLKRHADVSRSFEMRAMAGTPDTATDPDTPGKHTLIELKGVDTLYPLYGQVETTPTVDFHHALDRREGFWGAIAEQTLLDRLGIPIGARVRVGALDVVIRAVVTREPDRLAGGMALGPRLFLRDEAVRQTDLIRPGSLVKNHYRIRLAPDKRTNEDVVAWVRDVEATFPQAGWRIQDRSNSAPGVRRFVNQVALFLTLVGLTALVVGGVGVSNAVASYLDSRRKIIAIFKCLGAPGSLVFSLYFFQILALALAGIAIGLTLGALIPFAASTLAADLLPIPAHFALYPQPLILAGAFGLLTAIAFAIWPLARAREIPASGLMRDTITPQKQWPRPGYIAATCGTLFLLGVMTITFTQEREFAWWFVFGVGSSFAVLRLTAMGLVALARRAPRMKNPQLRLAIANLHRPGNATLSVVLSLGLGLTLLVSISLIDGNIEHQITGELPEQAPSFFFVDIGPEQVQDFEKIIARTPGITHMNRTPMLRGRIVRVAGVAAEDMVIPSEVAWALRGDRGITYAQTLPEGSTLVRGTWWDAGYQGPPLVSLSEELAAGFGVAPGDTLTVNVLGRDLQATIANTRQIDWSTLGINFVLIFSPGTLSGAPHTHLATVTMQEAHEPALQRAVHQAFPNVTSVRVKEALEAVNGLLKNLALAVRGISAITLGAGVLVLAGAMAAGHRRRVYDAVVFKVLGATRGKILGAYILEYILLGAGAALIAAGIGTVAAWLVITQVMEAPWVFLPETLLATVGVASVLTAGLGLAGTWRALSVKAAPVLRTE